jgi:succinate dehydrogenase / fumarate reductase flavoprotein subunit
MKIFTAKAIILACGGAGEAFAVHVFPPGMTGDGYALAYLAGAELVNMEFIQIGPASITTKLNCSGSVLRAVPRLVNEKNEEFLNRYLPLGMSPAETAALVFSKGASWPTCREKETFRFDVAVFKEILRGGRVYLDFSANPQGFSFRDLPLPLRMRYEGEIKIPGQKTQREESPYHRLREINPETVDWLKARGLDLAGGDRVEIAPCIQHFQGGVKIRQNGDTSLPGLYAAGEVAGGQHGANRPGGNALLDGQVFGARAGHAAAREALSLPTSPTPPLTTAKQEAFLGQFSPQRKGQKAAQARQAIQEILSQAASVIRHEAALHHAIKELGNLQKGGIIPDENGPAYFWETQNLLIVAEMIAKAALTRPESRGPHLFFADPDDHEPLPADEPGGRYYTVISQKAAGMNLEKLVPRPFHI